MARYTGPITKKSRRLKMDLVGGDKNFELRPFPPGQHGRRRIQEKEYLTQLQEKQRARFTYGVMEKQFVRYYKEAARRPGKTGENLLQILETRLDNVVYRLGFAGSRAQARQLVRHGHFLVNGRRVNIPSFGVRPDDVISLKSGSPAETIVRDATDLTAVVTPWLQADHDGLTGKVLKWPERAEIDTPVQESLIVELYSK